jgi:hypothetical protein
MARKSTLFKLKQDICFDNNTKVPLQTKIKMSTQANMDWIEYHRLQSPSPRYDILSNNPQVGFLLGKVHVVYDKLPVLTGYRLASLLLFIFIGGHALVDQARCSAETTVCRRCVRFFPT